MNSPIADPRFVIVRSPAGQLLAAHAAVHRLALHEECVAGHACFVVGAATLAYFMQMAAQPTPSVE